jgi:hypothetical protein
VEPLVVDPDAHAAEVARFERHVVRGPGVDDCAIWVGAIGADGYGRFWVRRQGRRMMLRANRYALAAGLGGAPLHPQERALHGCNNTACVRVSRPGEVGLLHIVGGTQRHNMEMMGRAGRGGGRPQILRRHAGLLQRHSRALALRAAVKDGWDDDAVRRALLGSADLTLW